MKKYVILAVAVVVVASLATLAAIRWNVWFGTFPEPAYTSQRTPYNVLLTFSRQGSGYRCVTWQCDTLAGLATLQCATPAGDTLSAVAEPRIYRSQGGASAFYQADVATPADGSYAYRICLADDTTGWYRFAVRSHAPGDTLQFIYIGDIQDTINGITGETTRSVARHYPHTDFFVLGGDLIHRPLEVYWSEAFDSMDTLAQSFPILAVTGNHEYLKGIGKTAEPRFALHFAYYQPGYDSTGVCCHTFTDGDLQLFLIDSNAGLPNLMRQRNRLAEELGSSRAKWKIAVLHHPPYSIRGQHNNIDVRTLFVPLFKQYKVDFVLAGHEHGYARLTTRDLDNRKQAPVYTVSHCSPKQYPLYINHKTDRYGTGERYFQRFTICGDTLRMQTFTTDYFLYDDVMLVKDGGHTVLTDLATGIPEHLQIPAQVEHSLKPGKLHDYRKSIEERTARRESRHAMP